MGHDSSDNYGDYVPLHKGIRQLPRVAVPRRNKQLPRLAGPPTQVPSSQRHHPHPPTHSSHHRHDQSREMHRRPNSSSSSSHYIQSSVHSSQNSVRGGSSIVNVPRATSANGRVNSFTTSSNTPQNSARDASSMAHRPNGHFKNTRSDPYPWSPSSQNSVRGGESRANAPSAASAKRRMSSFTTSSTTSQNSVRGGSSIVHVPRPALKRTVLAIYRTPAHTMPLTSSSPDRSPHRTASSSSNRYSRPSRTPPRASLQNHSSTSIVQNSSNAHHSHRSPRIDATSSHRSHNHSPDNSRREWNSKPTHTEPKDHHSPQLSHHGHRADRPPSSSRFTHISPSNKHMAPSHAARPPSPLHKPRPPISKEELELARLYLTTAQHNTLAIPDNASMYIVESESESDLHHAIKYGIWSCRTDEVNGMLSRDSSADIPTYLMVRSRGKTGNIFCGIALIVSEFHSEYTFPLFDTLRKGAFYVEWKLVKDIPSGNFPTVPCQYQGRQCIVATADEGSRVDNMYFAHILQRWKMVVSAIGRFPSIFDVWEEFEEQEKEQWIERKVKLSSVPAIHFSYIPFALLKSRSTETAPDSAGASAISESLRGTPHSVGTSGPHSSAPKNYFTGSIDYPGLSVKNGTQQLSSYAPPVQPVIPHRPMHSSSMPPVDPGAVPPHFPRAHPQPVVSQHEPSSHPLSHSHTSFSSSHTNHMYTPPAGITTQKSHLQTHNHLPHQNQALHSSRSRPATDAPKRKMKERDVERIVISSSSEQEDDSSSDSSTSSSNSDNGDKFNYKLLRRAFISFPKSNLFQKYTFAFEANALRIDGEFLHRVLSAHGGRIVKSREKIKWKKVTHFITTQEYYDNPPLLSRTQEAKKHDHICFLSIRFILTTLTGRIAVDPSYFQLNPSTQMEDSESDDDSSEPDVEMVDATPTGSWNPTSYFLSSVAVSGDSMWSCVDPSLNSPTNTYHEGASMAKLKRLFCTEFEKITQQEKNATLTKFCTFLRSEEEDVEKHLQSRIDNDPPSDVRKVYKSKTKYCKEYVFHEWNLLTGRLKLISVLDDWALACKYNLNLKDIKDETNRFALRKLDEMDHSRTTRTAASTSAESNSSKNQSTGDAEPPAPPPKKSSSDSVAPPKFSQIKKNRYIGQAATVIRERSEETHRCHCVPHLYVEPMVLSKGDETCGERCENRLFNFECTQKDIHGECTNKRFQKRKWVKTKVKPAPMKGFGLFTQEDVGEDDFVMEYVGEIINNDELERRKVEYAKQALPHYYFISLENNMTIDATQKGCNARFMNHSCDPNCETQKWNVGKHSVIGIFALKDIKKGDELTFDYGFERFGGVGQKCYCGSKNCRGVIQAKKKDKKAARRSRRKNLRNTFNQLVDKMIQMDEPDRDDYEDAASTGNPVFLWRNLVCGFDRVMNQLESFEDQLTEDDRQEEKEKDEVNKLIETLQITPVQARKLYKQMQEEKKKSSSNQKTKKLKKPPTKEKESSSEADSVEGEPQPSSVKSTTRDEKKKSASGKKKSRGTEKRTRSKLRTRIPKKSKTPAAETADAPKKSSTRKRKRVSVARPEQRRIKRKK